MEVSKLNNCRRIIKCIDFLTCRSATDFPGPLEETRAFGDLMERLPKRFRRRHILANDIPFMHLLARNVPLRRGNLPSFLAGSDAAWARRPMSPSRHGDAFRP